MMFYQPDSVVINFISLFLTHVFYVICDRFGENRPKRSKQFFSASPGKALWVDFFRKKKIMAEMDRHQLALAYDAVVSSGVL